MARVSCSYKRNGTGMITEARAGEQPAPTPDQTAYWLLRGNSRPCGQQVCTHLEGKLCQPWGCCVNCRIQERFPENRCKGMCERVKEGKRG